MKTELFRIFKGEKTVHSVTCENMTPQSESLFLCSTLSFLSQLVAQFDHCLPTCLLPPCVPFRPQELSTMLTTVQ